ncbi:PREDICTED: anaphase-promoting complex subunit CDC26-like isoform X2 [Nicrophorus vespilloides]|uniref:Anaphase-promoting complex subunit CDC26-like isoform X2 n=1 Tax=Nicrophorus vespilloides TaxID=110193 RepID=A0ABM1M0G0_NICVS|nr:PREDICTED: anaphase-promoting complex subunit CDC26-like isoform X2 [Nicrophorus vespilloides]
MNLSARIPLLIRIDKMLRRPPTNVELKLDDILEYNTMKKEQESSKDPSDSKSFNTPPTWNAGPKSKSEVYKRVGYIPPATSPIY